MKRIFLIEILLGCWLGLAGLSAQAAISCTLSSTAAVNFVYVPGTTNASSNNVRQGSITANCTRTNPADPTSLWLGVDNGLNNSGQQNNLRLSTSLLAYDIYANSNCSARVGLSNNRVEVTLTSSAAGTASFVFPYWACIPTSQALVGFPAGQYTDSVQLGIYSASNGGTALATGTLAVNALAPASCSIGRAPGTVSFSYTAFSANAAFAGTNFRADCSSGLTYTMALSPPAGVVAGLRYTLGLSLSAAGNAANIGPTSLQATGNSTGMATHFINGVMEAGQAGQSGAIVPQVHTLTISY